MSRKKTPSEIRLALIFVSHSEQHLQLRSPRCLRALIGLKRLVDSLVGVVIAGGVNRDGGNGAGDSDAHVGEVMVVLEAGVSNHCCVVDDDVCSDCCGGSDEWGHL
ncbi:Hypothetical predicted protein [Olea europaea subsp. europaea]|uniref:Uncharacterized protein n=1 Tax=Olea europaea subsp. europaea TaxID=158383 RepID=A0A8S0SWU5_OLEEU|nr:Hypothetical predicted protein [Olea europaea subsp. europaea]